MHINVDGPHARYTKGHRGQYNGDIDGAIDDFLVVLKGEARRLLRKCAEDTPALREFPLRLRLGEGTDAPVTLDTPPIQARLC